MFWCSWTANRIVFLGTENGLFGLFWIFKIFFYKHPFYGKRLGRIDSLPQKMEVGNSYGINLDNMCLGRI